MEYVYAAAILNELDREINENNVKAVLEAAGADVSESRVKALIAALEDVDIDERIAAASPAMLPEDEQPAAPVESGTEAGGAEEIEESDETMPEPAGEDAGSEGEDDEESTGLDDIF